ncbi:hypothetical protein KVR01_012445 [Diaporthe batatas]|uniref:uncharacterized protein n=1 Tax=Diaporthe batatas TaxID=748121 RepID=UPI001D04EC31|nr:uncharacterized protein KVR01_012445 [Diaporthe batatas]KAG8157783.1 hypothetical protein KVR01_012445 [Diaporthe batatas]
MSATLTPFLFQTRTLARYARSGPVAPTRLARSLHASPSRRRRQAERDPIPFELPPDLENPDARRGSEVGVKGTITPLERQAFESIFREISEKGKSLPTVTPKKQNAPSLAQKEPNFLKGLYDGAPFNVNAIMQDAAEKQSASTPNVNELDPLSPLQSTFSAAEREEALLQFPPSLRRAARTAYGMMESARDIPVATEGGGQEGLGLERDAVEADAVEAVASTDNLARKVEADASRREARLTIRAKMEKAENDFALWEVVEKEVFSLVDKLGLAAAPPGSKPQKQKPSRKKKAAAGDEGANADASAAAPKPLLNMDTYGPIYPMLLLDALHMLDNKFSRPSPLAFSLLPRIKELGLPSYVLGVSTSFYNKLLTVMWERFGDVPGVFALLEEMRHAGLQFDEETKSVLHRIDYVLRSVQRGESGFFLRKMMKMPEYEPILETRMSNWIGHIDWNINHRLGRLRNRSQSL